jgi:chromosome segregation ATPase
MTDIQKEIKEVKQDLKEWDEHGYCSINPEHVRKLLDLIESKQELIEQLQQSFDDAEMRASDAIAERNDLQRLIVQKDAEINRLKEVCDQASMLLRHDSPAYRVLQDAITKGTPV